MTFDSNRHEIVRSWFARVLLSIAILVVAPACAPAGSEPEVAASPLETSEPEMTGVDDPVTGDPDPDAGDSVGGGQSLIDSEELIGLGELGLLPSLVQTFGARIDCDFEDAFSTCQ